MVYDGDCRVLDSLNNVMQARFCGGYYFGEIAGKRRKLFEALGVPVPDAEPEKGTGLRRRRRNRILERPIWFRGRPLLEALNFAIFQNGS